MQVQEGLPVIGSLGVVLLAKRKAIIPCARSLLQRLECETGMYLSSDIRDEALRSVGE